MENEKNILKTRLFKGAVIYAILFLFIVTTANIEIINSWLSSLMKILRPVLIGLVIAYLCNPFFRFFEKNVFCKLNPSALRRSVSLVFTYLSVLLILLLLMAMILPQLANSIGELIKNYESYSASALAEANKGIDKLNGIIAQASQTENAIPHLESAAIMDWFMNWIRSIDVQSLATSEDVLAPITNTLSNAFSAATDAIFGLFISIYLLSTKEKRYRQIMKLRNALFSDHFNGRISKLCEIADRSFGKFLEGKIIDSLIIGVLAYIVTSILDIPYAILVATFIGITNVIPVIGPFIGAIPTAFIILLADSSKVIPFLIVVLVLQQIDGNIIGPKILGNNTGVSSLCVMISIATMTSLWGLAGALLAVPIFATVLELSDLYVEERLQKKGLPSSLEAYYAAGVDVEAFKDDNSDKAIHKLEKKVLAIRRKQEDDPTAPLSRKDRFHLKLYAAAYKLHILSDVSDETYRQFSTALTESQALHESDQRINAIKAEDAAGRVSRR